MVLAIFKDHMLADHPEYAKYFKTQRFHASGSGDPDPEATLAPGRAAASATHSAAAAAAASSGDTRTSPRTHSTSSSSLSLDEPHASPSKRALSPRSPAPGPALLAPWRAYRSSRLRRHVYLTLSHPEYSHLALTWGVFMIAIILLNTVTFCLESVPHYADTPLYDRLVIVDYVCLGLFTAEFVVRLATCDSLLRFAGDLMNWVDFVAIAPFYVELIVLGPNSQEASQTRIIRLVRLLRTLRLLRATERFRNLQVVIDSLVASGDVLAMLMFLLLVLLVVSSTVIYYIEQAIKPDTWFDSIPLTMWYMQVTLTTTGYGDYYAQTAWGRFVAGVFMLLCMVTMSLPISVVGGNFSAMWSRYSSIKDGLDRSAAAHRTMGRLRAALRRHRSAMDNVVGAINRVKCELEDGRRASAAEGPGAGPEGLKALGEELAHVGAQVAHALDSGADPATLHALRDRAASIRARLAAARNRYQQLQALLAVSNRLVSRDLSDMLGRLHNVHKEMAGWAADGQAVRAQAETLLADLRALRGVVPPPPEEAEEEEAGEGEGEDDEEAEGKGGKN
ncbi:hypothetical protein HYH03_008112 [Edaphochlamys debaryana]|uniref:Ion transport domain-containing protein n=1 Tax=Edaphochlamys debaryana TaxID=47281 RepID=A0A835Y9P3_9CHLO|nr:hypothetical protein HYH03_008112 [Edaphochlamys debaryana]|eukprot:KAG2493594.1 hypothetical protein HYH03_008112 [Edaphochlamys debaryana]